MRKHLRCRTSLSQKKAGTQQNSLLGLRGRRDVPWRRFPLAPTPPPVMCTVSDSKLWDSETQSRFFLCPGWRTSQTRFDKSNSRAGNVSAAQSEQADLAGAGTQVWFSSPGWSHPRIYPACVPSAPPTAWHPVGAFESVAPKADFPLSKQPC